MFIDDLVVNASVYDIVSELKRQLAEHKIYYFAKIKDSGDDLMVCCPYHKYGQEQKPSMGIRKADGMCHCFACSVTQSLPEMITHCWHTKDALYGYRWLASNFASTRIENREPIQLNLNRDKPVSEYEQFYVPDEELDKYRYVHPYMYKRGLTDEVIEEFDIGYDKATDSITFPVRDLSGRCMFVAKRTVVGKKFDLPKDLKKPLYGLYEVHKCKPCNEIYVVEGLFDCLRLWCNGIYAVAGFGCLFSDKQTEQLRHLPTRKLVLALDNDEAGRKATSRLSSKINNKLLSKVILPDNRKDIGECTDKEIKELPKKFL